MPPGAIPHVISFFWRVWRVLDALSGDGLVSRKTLARKPHFLPIYMKYSTKTKAVMRFTQPAHLILALCAAGFSAFGDDWPQYLGAHEE